MLLETSRTSKYVLLLLPSPLNPWIGDRCTGCIRSGGGYIGRRTLQLENKSGWAVLFVHEIVGMLFWSRGPNNALFLFGAEIKIYPFEPTLS